MVTRLLASQVSFHWDLIKYALAQVEGIDPQLADGVFNTVFAKLMADKMQAFLISDSEKVTGVVITELIDRLASEYKTMNIRLVYAFDKVDNETWEKTFKLIKKLAGTDQCSNVLISTSHLRIKELCKDNNFKKVHSTFEYKIGA